MSKEEVSAELLENLDLLLVWDIVEEEEDWDTLEALGDEDTEAALNEEEIENES